jgi:hypothetical protein
MSTFALVVNLPVIRDLKVARIDGPALGNRSLDSTSVSSFSTADPSIARIHNSSQVLDFTGGERGTRTLDLCIMSAVIGR